MPYWGGGGYMGVVTALLLDSISTVPTAAYSTRKLTFDFAGSAMRVRESGGSTESDIGFTTAGLLDTGTLLAFVNGADGFITKWYDQSGNGFDAAQATAANQPRIVSAGVLDTVNNNPALNFISASNCGLGITATLTNLIGTAPSATYTVLNGIRIRGGNGNYTGNNFQSDSVIVDTDDFWGPLGAITDTGVTKVRMYHYDGAYEDVDVATTFPVTKVLAARLRAGTMSLYVNGGTPTTLASASINHNVETASINIGRSYNSAFTIDSLMQDLIIFSNGLSSADLNTLGSGLHILAGGNMSNYSGVTWSTVA